MKKTLLLLISVAMICSFAGCSEKNKQQAEIDAKETTSEVKEEKIVDGLDREIEKPENIERISITCNGGAIQEVSVLHQNQKVVSQPDISKFKMLSKMYENLNHTEDVGSFKEVNLEGLLSLNPDIVFVGNHTQQMNDKIDEVGLKTFNLYCGMADINSLLKEFKNVGLVLGAEEESTKLLSYWEEKMDMVSNMVKNVPENERKSVYYVGNDITSAKTGEWDKSFIEFINADYAAGVISNGSEISVEQVLNMNPDVIVKAKNEKGLAQILDDERISKLKAVEEKQVYQFPIGGFWWDRPSPESPLGFMWLAKTVYPEYTKDIDLKKETKEFFKEFYDYTLSDEEYESFF